MASVFNSEEYAWSDISATLLGRNIAGLLAIKYKSSQDKELRYGRGNRPIGFKRGNKKYEGSITILKSELDALKAASPNGDLTDLRNIDIVFSYGDTETGQLKTDIAKFVEFTESEQSMKQGDGSGEFELPFICLDIQAA